ncbi:hypothetical protein B0J12DRAFT_702482 [Macrophomina phaseolina]|uniref:Heme oxygenase-like protein n=1 Tax=Macrophomina phaseolina TaxID=35725 RepID=A0ABQ8G1E0_9PEZI|nr:hypothetical protein B0J12DRAFT_702482 [Macrophomina phaseolina]
MTTENRSRPAAAARPSLSTEINVATRLLHTNLNRLITARLPLALPPHAASPRLYAFGLLHFSHVYLTFESAWHDITHPPTALNNPALSSLLEDPWISVSQPPPTSDTSTAPSAGASSTATPSSPTTPTDPALLAFLTTLLPPGLLRSRRLRRDLAALLALRPMELDVHLATGYPGPRVAAYTAHIRRAVRARPHVLVAYAWVMYMAIFAGGRWIRAQLASAGPEFWEGENENNKGKGVRGVSFEEIGKRGLSFFAFDGDMDGEDVKSAFKARLEEAEALLTEQQRREVVEEARAIFEWSIALVEELDELLDTPDALHVEVGAGRGAPRDEKEMSEKGGVLPAPVPAPRQKTDWVRQGGSIAGALVVLGGVCWWTACFLGVAMREGWHEGWTDI